MSKPSRTVWYTRAPHPSPLGLAAQLGWFLEEFMEDGIDVFTLQESEDAHLRESHLDHHLTNSFRQGGSAPAIWARSRGADTRVIGFNWLDEYQGIITRDSSGIRSPRDLAGRRIALPRSTAPIDLHRAEALRGFVVALEIAGLTSRAVDFVDVAIERQMVRERSAPPSRYGTYDNVIAALERGDVDAIYVKGARGLQATRESGAHVVLDIHSHPDPLVRANHGVPRPITVDCTLLNERPDIVARFLARIVAVGNWAARHPAETALYVSRETRCAEHWVRGAYGADLHHFQRTDINDTCIAGLRAYSRFLLEHDFIPNDFSMEAWVDPAPLAAATALLRARESPLRIARHGGRTAASPALLRETQ